MADFAPSFSLGLDFDLDSEPQEERSPKPAPQFSSTFGDDVDFETPGPDPKVSDPPLTLKRLRRGPTPVAQKTEPVVSWSNVDDEIEDFSSQEDKPGDEPVSTPYQSVGINSKLPLPRHGILSTQSAKKMKNVSSGPIFSNVDMSSNKSVFPKLTVSPLRRFQLIDSDSDSDNLSGDDRAKLEANKAGSSSKERQINHGKHMRPKASTSMSQTEDLWNDFCPEKSFNIPTPAFDKVCEEYFRSMKNKNDDLNNMKGCYESNNISKNYEQQINLGDPLPPAHQYFFHDDTRIQNLVRNRLPNFYPLGAANNRGSEQPTASVIDYIGQFSHGESSKQAAGRKKAEVSSTRSRKRTKKTDAGEVSQGSGSWVNPKHTTELPKDAGKRRVQAVGQSAGHWFTGSNGKRVYVTKAGQELTGQTAYRHYKKETQGGFKNKKARKKTGRRKK